MRHLPALMLAVVMLAACGSSGGDSTSSPAPAKASGAESPTSTEPSPTPSSDSASEPRQLSSGDLAAALLTINDIPPGYSADPPDESAVHTFCNYTSPVKETESAAQTFTKDEGLMTEVVKVGIRQYGSADDAARQMDALVSAMNTCTSETYAGIDATYALMSAPKLGKQTIGIRINFTTQGVDVALEELIVLDGAALIQVGQGGIGVAFPSIDEVAQLTETQIQNYEAAAGI